MNRHPPRSTLFPYTTLSRPPMLGVPLALVLLAVAAGALIVQAVVAAVRSEEHTSELQSIAFFVCRLCFFNEPAPTEIYTFPLHDALPTSDARRPAGARSAGGRRGCAHSPGRRRGG